MKQKLLNKLWLRSGMLVAILCTLFAGQAWADDNVLTLDCATPASSSGSTDMNASAIATFLNSAAGLSSAEDKITCSAKSGTVYTGKGSGGGSIPQQCLKIGKASGGGSFTFTIPDTYDEVDVVELTCYGWKTTSSISINNGTSQTFTTAQVETTKTFELASSTRTISIEVTTSAVCVTEIILKKSSSGGSTLEDPDLALTGAPVELSFDLNGNASEQVISYTTSSTGAVTVSSSDYITTEVNESAKTITVTPTAVTPSTQTITVSQAADDDYKDGQVTFTVSIVDTTPVPTHTATFSINGETTTQDFEEGEAIEFPSTTPDNIDDKVFRGWVAAPIDGTTNVEPAFVTSATMGNSDVTYYAVFADVIPGTSELVEDELTRVTTGVSGTSSYSDWSGKTAKSDAVYAGNSAGDKGSIQLRSNNNNSGLVTTTSGGKVKNIIVTWNAATSDGRTINIYGKNSAYEAASDLYDKNKQGTLLGTLAKGSTTLAVTGDYEYVGIRSASGALYLEDITITWEAGTPDTYSDYCTTVVASSVAKPVITVADNPFYFSTTAEITYETDDATIYYSFDGENWEVYEGPLNIIETKIIYAKAVKDEDESKVVSVTATKNLAEPTVAVSGDLTLDLAGETSVAAGTLTASVTYNEAAVDGATVAWSSSDEAIATIDETGAVTLLTTGEVTFTATYAGNDDYAEATGTKTITIIDSTVPGTEGNPYTVADVIDGTATGSGIYVKGFIVGCYKNNAFSATAKDVNSNLALADAANETDPDKIIPVELPSGDRRTDLNVVDHFYNVGVAQILYKGNAQSYFGVKGVKGAQVGTKKIAEYVTVSSKGYATYYTDCNLDFTGTDIAAYAGTIDDGTKLTFAPVSQVPANEGVLLVAADGKSAIVPVVENATSISNNCMEGTLAATTLNAADYILNVVDGQAGFFLAGSHTSLAAHRAYIPAGAGVKSFALDLEDNADGIEETFSDSLLKSENIYNLAGQRLSKMQKGINIVNGKKVLK